MVSKFMDMGSRDWLIILKMNYVEQYVHGTDTSRFIYICVSFLKQLLVHLMIPNHF